eukprot:scaffold74457_cov74-Phaeocystis_antarctica.AAC.3
MTTKLTPCTATTMSEMPSLGSYAPERADQHQRLHRICGGDEPWRGLADAVGHLGVVDGHVGRVDGEPQIEELQDERPVREVPGKSTAEG